MGDILKALKRPEEASGAWRQSLQIHDDPKVREKLEH
jgi:predicted negative regulator of RcsB-dependent stress response